MIQYLRKQRVAIERELEPSDDALAKVARWVPEGFPRPTAETVRTFSAVVCNNLVDYYSTEFTDRALGQIALLVPGSNGMRNHDAGWSLEALPVCRYYDAFTREIPGVLTRTGGQAIEVVGSFYHERGTEFAEMMAKRIMLGIWREVSLSWWMRLFTNSIDGKPFDESPYYAGQVFEDGTVCIGIMDDVMEVEEISLVPRGGQKGTSIGPATRGRDVLDILGDARARAMRSREADPPRSFLKNLLASGSRIE